MPVYAYFQPPPLVCRGGDFRSIEEAGCTMRRLKATGVFKEVSIVREQINIPLTNMEELLHPEWSAEKIEQLKGHYQSILSYWAKM